MGHQWLLGGARCGPPAQQIAGEGMFVSLHRRSRIKIAPAVESDTLQTPADRSGAEAGCARDLIAGRVLATQFDDAVDKLGWRSAWRDKRSRGTVAEPLDARSAKAADPLGRRLGSDQKAPCGSADRVAADNKQCQLLSTAEGKSGILVDVHSVLFGETGLLVTISFSVSDRMDNLLKDHRWPTQAFCWLEWGSLKANNRAGASGGGYATYNASGALNAATLGGVVALSNIYNSRLQPLTLQATGPGGTLMSRTYDFGLGVNDNGAVRGITDGLDSFNISNRPMGSAGFSYDALNRLTQAQSTGTDCSPAGSTTRNWGNTYTVDPWGNLTNKGAVSGLTGCVSELLNQPVGVNNRVSGTNVHDAAGNMIQNGALVYDRENRLASAGGESYVYDGDGQRVAKTGSTTMLYWTGVTGAIIAESDAAGVLSAEYVFFNGQRIARVDNPASAPVAHYYVADNLGSATVIASEAGAVEREQMYYPYGGERWSQGSDTNRYKFTGKERDTETGLDYFGARYYGSNMGRWMSPDYNGTDDGI